MSATAKRAWCLTPSTELAGLCPNDILQKSKHSKNLAPEPAVRLKLLTCTLCEVHFTRKKQVWRTWTSIITIWNMLMYYSTDQLGFLRTARRSQTARKCQGFYSASQHFLNQKKLMWESEIIWLDIVICSPVERLAVTRLRCDLYADHNGLGSPWDGTVESKHGSSNAILGYSFPWL